MFALLLILIFIRPFISSLAFPYLNAVYSGLLMVFLVVWLSYKGISIEKIQPVKYPLILFGLALIISFIFSINKFNSLKEIYKYITALLLFMTAVSLTYEDRIRVMNTLVYAGVIISLLAIYQYFFGFRHLLNYINKAGITDISTLHYITTKRVFLPFVTPNTLAGYLAMIIPLAFLHKKIAFDDNLKVRFSVVRKVLYIFLHHKKRIWFIIPVSIALLLTKSLGVFISIFFALNIYFYLKGRLERKTILFLSVLIVIIGIIFMVRSATPRHLQPFFSTIMRLNYWQETLRIIQARPLTGVGIGNFNLVHSRYAHNSYLQIWADVGILGLISFLWLIGAIFRNNLKNIIYVDRNTVMILILSNAVFLIHNFIDFTLFLPEVSLVWWLIIGLFFSFH